MHAVELIHVTKRYGGRGPALEDVTLAVAAGELLAVVGPSGCGKSTLLRVIAGLEDPDGGDVRIDGHSVTGMPPRARNVAMVFQDYALYPNRTVRGNVEFPLEMAGVDRTERERRVGEVLAMLELTKEANRLPRELSGGQRQRVAMARALVREPAVFLLDEPLSNLDAKLRTQVRGEIGELQRRTGTAMIYVTHDQTEAMTLGDRVVVLEAGRVRQVGTPREIYDRPADRFVAGFLGSPPMNVLPCTLRRSDSGLFASIAGQAIAVPKVESPLVLDEAVAIGIRPEELGLGSDGKAVTLACEAERCEYLGHETVLYARLGGHSLAARLAGHVEVGAGTVVSLVIDWPRVHFFGADGKRL